MSRLIKLLLFVLLFASPAGAATLYVSPSGSGTKASTSCADTSDTTRCPLSQISTAGVAAAGDTWILKDGTYGPLSLDCSAGINNGTGAALVTVQAENERQAFIQSNGSTAALVVSNCAYWTFSGLRAESADSASYSNQMVVDLESSSNLIFKRGLLRFDNRYANSALLFMANVSNSVIEENELYSYHRYGIQLGGVQNSIIRRNYMNSRGYADIGGGFSSANGWTQFGDGGINIYTGTNTNNVIENNISEGNGGGFWLNNVSTSDTNTRLYGNISLNDAWGFHGAGTGNYVENHVVVNGASATWIGSGSSAFEVPNPDSTIFKNGTIIGSGRGGMRVFEEVAGASSFTGQNVLILSSAEVGFTATSDIETWTVNSIDAFNNTGGNYSPSSSGNYANQKSQDASVGSCYLWIPDTSPMKNAGVGGADIGANILYQYDAAGNLTANKLWDPTTGAPLFKGATVTGVNDVAGSSLYDIASRLNINQNGCSFPSSYTPPPPAACDYYASPTGSGDGLTQKTPFKISGFWAVASAGKTLCLLDGVYTDANSNIAPTSGLNGAAGNPITVKAINDGAVRIDGGGAQYPILLVNNSYINIEGINVHNSSADVVRLSTPSTNNIIRRVVGWDAADINAMIFSTSGVNNLFEDVAGFGVARKVFSFADSTTGGNVCRRCWGRWEGSTNVGPKDTFELIYNSKANIWENVIGTWNNGSMPSSYVLQNNGTIWGGGGAGTYTDGDVNQPYGVIAESDAAVTDFGGGVFGSIGYVKAADKFQASSVVAFEQGGQNFTFNGVVAYLGGHASQQAILLSSGSGNTASNLTGIATPADTFSGGWTTSNLEHATTAGAASSIYTGGVGADVCYRTVDGKLTNTPLWPWPMNQRIIDATTLAADAGHQHYIYQGGTPTLTLVTNPHTIENVTATIESLLGTIPSACKTPTGTLPYVDLFDRTDGALGASWQGDYSPFPNLALVNGKVRGSAQGDSNIQVYASVVGTNQYGQATLSSFSGDNDAAIVLRASASPTATFYYVTAKTSGDPTVIYKVQAGSSSLVASGGKAAWGADDTFLATAVDQPNGSTLITTYRNGAFEFAWADVAPLTGTYVGLGLYAGGALGEVELDNFEAGLITQSNPPTPLVLGTGGRFVQ